MPAVRRIAVLVLIVAVLMSGSVAAGEEGEIQFEARSAVLMDARTGKILLSHNGHEPLPPASITKIMTMALIFEAVEEGRVGWDDRVTASELAASMGGSQIWLVAGEVMTLRELTTAIAIASANDASVAVAEHVAGSHDAFVALMNERARQLGMNSTTFRNPHGLDEDGHLISAVDVAIMSSWAAGFDGLLALTSQWEDYLRDGASWLVNTNRLIKSVPGADGLKTGSTSLARFCLSATASRDGTRMVAVIMGAPDSTTRFDEARSLLNYGFARYETRGLLKQGQVVAAVQVSKGVIGIVDAVAASDLAVTIRKGDDPASSVRLELPEIVPAPLLADRVIGRAVYEYEGEEFGVDLIPVTTIERAHIGQMFLRVVRALLQQFR